MSSTLTLYSFTQQLLRTCCGPGSVASVDGLTPRGGGGLEDVLGREGTGSGCSVPQEAGQELRMAPGFKVRGQPCALPTKRTLEETLKGKIIR